MFRITFFCDDKKLADVMHKLAGLAAGIPEIQPVANAVHKNGKVQAASGSVSELFDKYAKQHKIKKFKAADLTEFCQLAGMAPASRGYIIKQLHQAGAIRKYGKGTHTYYAVVA